MASKSSKLQPFHRALKEQSIGYHSQYNLNHDSRSFSQLSLSEHEDEEEEVSTVLHQSPLNHSKSLLDRSQPATTSNVSIHSPAKEILPHEDPEVVMPIPHHRKSSSSRHHRHSSISRPLRERHASNSRRSTTPSKLKSRSSLRHSTTNTLAIFGFSQNSSPTVRHLGRLALSAGYRVQVYGKPDETLVRQSLYTAVESTDYLDEDAVQSVVEGARYVVVIPPEQEKKKQNKKSSSSITDSSRDNTATGPIHMASFLQVLYPILQRSSTVKVFLYQATALDRDIFAPRRETGQPVLAKLMQSLVVPTNTESLQYIKQQRRRKDRKPSFHLLLPRVPVSILRDSTSSKPQALCASKSLPGPRVLAYADVARFLLQAMQDEDLYDTSPYVVSDWC